MCNVLDSVLRMIESGTGTEVLMKDAAFMDEETKERIIADYAVVARLYMVCWAFCAKHSNISCYKDINGTVCK